MYNIGKYVYNMSTLSSIHMSSIVCICTKAECRHDPGLHALLSLALLTAHVGSPLSVNALNYGNPAYQPADARENNCNDIH